MSEINLILNDGLEKNQICIDKSIFNNTDSYFKKLFSGDFRETHQNEIELHVLHIDQTLEIIRISVQANV